MFKDRKFSITILVFVFLISLLGAKLQEKYLYVKDKTGNLLDAPEGTKINQLLQKTKVKVVEETG
jgi:hypothetical protein